MRTGVLGATSACFNQVWLELGGARGAVFGGTSASQPFDHCAHVDPVQHMVGVKLRNDQPAPRRVAQHALVGAAR